MSLKQVLPSVGDYSTPITGMPSRQYIIEDAFDRKDRGLALVIRTNSLAATAENVCEEGRRERERDRRRKKRTTRREE